jgi:crotonobetainyl-CoA:carnitine CoA-transferase CaiB-like acyl-CoA transferase
VLADAQFHHNGLVDELQDQDGEVMKFLRTPIRLGKTPAQVRTPMPDLGQHTETILQELGYTGDAIQQLREQGIVAG